MDDLVTSTVTSKEKTGDEGELHSKILKFGVYHLAPILIPWVPREKRRSQTALS